MLQSIDMTVSAYQEDINEDAVKICRLVNGKQADCVEPKKAGKDKFLLKLGES